MKKYLLLFIATFTISHLMAQDQIYRKGGTVVKAKIVEIGSEAIKYKLYNDQDGPIYVLETSRIDHIAYQNGRIEKFSTSFKDPENYVGQLGKGIKMNFLSPLMGYAQFSFEKSVSPLKSYELGFGIIGAGKNQQIGNYYVNGQYEDYRRNALGGFLQAGYKFNKLPDYISSGRRLSHIMQGTYIEPTFTLGYYTDQELSHKTGTTELAKRHNLFGGILINLGHQWVFGDKLLVDIYYGLGYAFDNSRNRNRENYFDDNSFNHFVLQKIGSGPNLGLNGGLRIGLLIK